MPIDPTRTGAAALAGFDPTMTGRADECPESNDSLGWHSDTYENGDWGSPSTATCEWCGKSNSEWEAVYARDLTDMARLGAVRAG